MNESHRQSPSSVFVRGAIVAVIVGPLLTLINQFDGIFGSTTFNWTSFGLTMVVPFCVSSFSGWISLRGARAILQTEMARHVTEVEAIRLQAQREVASATTAANVASSRFEGPEEKLWQVALDGIENIRRNAQSVNVSSVERVKFIAGLINQFELIQNSFSDLLSSAEHAKTHLNTMDESTTCITKGVSDMAADSDILVDTVNQFESLREAFNGHFEAVKQATDKVSGLASQIRLLALNASVEAANVGDAGKGFSIIALEVRHLADRANSDVSQINSVLTALEDVQKQVATQMQSVAARIDESRENASRCVDLSGDAGQQIKQMSQNMRRLTESLADQLPQILTLVAGVRQIKENTEAAVDGSARNIALCGDVLQALGSADIDAVAA